MWAVPHVSGDRILSAAQQYRLATAARQATCCRPLEWQQWTPTPIPCYHLCRSADSGAPFRLGECASAAQRGPGRAAQCTRAGGEEGGDSIHSCWWTGRAHPEPSVTKSCLKEQSMPSCQECPSICWNGSSRLQNFHVFIPQVLLSAFSRQGLLEVLRNQRKQVQPPALRACISGGGATRECQVSEGLSGELGSWSVSAGGDPEHPGPVRATGSDRDKVRELCRGEAL